MNKKSAFIRLSQIEDGKKKTKKEEPKKNKKETPFEAARAPKGRMGSSLGMGLVGTVLKATMGKKKPVKVDGKTGASKKVTKTTIKKTTKK
jgi:hypothetical protein